MIARESKGCNTAGDVVVAEVAQVCAVGAGPPVDSWFFSRSSSRCSFANCAGNSELVVELGLCDQSPASRRRTATADRVTQNRREREGLPDRGVEGRSLALDVCQRHQDSRSEPVNVLVPVRSSVHMSQTPPRRRRRWPSSCMSVKIFVTVQVAAIEDDDWRFCERQRGREPVRGRLDSFEIPERPATRPRESTPAGPGALISSWLAARRNF